MKFGTGKVVLPYGHERNYIYACTVKNESKNALLQCADCQRLLHLQCCAWPSVTLPAGFALNAVPDIDWSERLQMKSAVDLCRTVTTVPLPVLQLYSKFSADRPPEAEIVEISDVMLGQAGSACVNRLWVLNIHCSVLLQLAAEINVKVWFYFDDT